MPEHANVKKTKNNGLNQYGAEPFEQHQFGTAGVEGLNCYIGIFSLSVYGQILSH